MRASTRILVLIALITSPVLAQPLADKVPANPVMYIGWRGSDDLGSAYEQSHLKAIVDQSNIKAMWTDMMPRAVMRIGRQNVDAGAVAGVVANLSNIFLHHPTAFYVADVDCSGDFPMPKAALLCQAGNDSQKLLTQLNSLLKNADRCPVPLRAYQSGDLVVFSAGYTEDQDAVALATAKPLSQEQAFTSAMNNVQKDPVIAMYVNVERAIALIDQGVEKKGDPHAQEYWPKVRDAIGLAGMKRFIATDGFEGKDWQTMAFIEAPSPRAGLVTMLDSAPLDENLLKLAPADCDRVCAGTFDIAKLVATIRAAVAQVDPNAGAMADKAIGAVSLFIGRDVQKEVLEPIGEHWLAYSSPTIAGRGMFGTIVVNQLRDPKKAEQGIMATQLAIFNTAAGYLGRQGVTLRAQNFKSGDLSINYVAIPFISPAWCVSSGDLYLALFPQNIISAAHFKGSEGKSILDNPDFQNLRKRLNAPEKIHAIAYQDLSQTAGESYQGVLALSRLVLGFGDLFGVRSPEPVLPPLDVILKNLGPSGSVTWVDDTGWHARSITSFPGAELLGGVNLGSMIPLLTTFSSLGQMHAHPF